jgi:hypothetical protein
VTCWVSFGWSTLTLRAIFFTKSLAHDRSLERCVPLVSQMHTLLSYVLNLHKIQFVFYA